MSITLDEAIASRDSLIAIQRAQIEQLFAECARLRAAAREALDAYGWQSDEAHQRCECPRCKLAAVLTQATDSVRVEAHQ